MAVFVPARSLIVPPQRRQTRKQNRRRGHNAQAPHVQQQQQQQQAIENKLLDQKLKELQALAHSVKTEIAKKREDAVQNEVGTTNDSTDPEEEDIDMLFNELMLEDSPAQATLALGDGQTSVSLFDTPARGIDLPKSILTRLEDSVRNIVVKDNANWDALIADLSDKRGRFIGLTNSEVGQFLKQIPVGGVGINSLERIEEMLKEVSSQYTDHQYDFFMKHYSANGDAKRTQELFDGAIADGFKPSKYMFAHLIKGYVKTNNLARINLTLQKMTTSGVEPPLPVLTNVLQLCVNLKDWNQADDIFQMMKFRSTKTKPDVNAYNTMLRLTSRKRDIHRALDLYHEMFSMGVEPDIFTYNTLIQACSKNREHFTQGYNFIAEIHERNLEPNIKTFEAMLRLVARDGDLELARALYLTIFEKKSQSVTNDAESLVYLLMAYRDFKPGHVPQIMNHKDGMMIRRNTLRMVDFMGLHQTQVEDVRLQRQREMYPPMLPLSNLHSSKHIIAESTAVWAFNVANNPMLLNSRTLIIYLRIAVEHSDKAEFMKRWEQYTFANREIDENQIVIETADAATEPVEELQEGSTPPALQYLKQMNYRVERNSELYLTFLSAGRNFEDVEMCEQAWVERGKFRSTSAYQKFSRREKAELDFRFAQEMVKALTHLQLYSDAVDVVKSSERQFPWSFYVLKPLYVACQHIGDQRGAREISAICGKDKGRNFDI